ncbi:rna-dependent rna polymerase [Metarhizium robertsii ARSEF 23]|uniref:RNA-dependent RNA polymerase n=1 Tax=Metarhizium robertsii (strain ARSEF 23 / ATCC MYA-3075) TaxID=655844 RepID=A0A0B2X9K5_METRA|nr:rna-dependent rna polymerase [Metarhizium robertsii ARSEF 23]KHO11538.1 rna-dependent rna polymerase [Metarhizium robertsii ARSEF 23]
MPVHKLMDWAIGGLSTTNQQVPKLFSRITLSLSHTHATVVLEKHQIHSLDYDIGTHSTMNDGIGRISKALATKIASKLGLTDLPCAFQARLGSAKGMWIIDSDPTLGDGDWIVTYASQVKWDCDHEDSHHRTFEVKEWPKEPRPASLNQQFIPVLEAQAINPAKMRNCISAHLRRGLLEELAAQKMAIEDPAEMRLWLQQGGGSKPEGPENSMAFLGGLPRDPEKAMAFLLDSGFHPKSCKYLQELCWRAAHRRTEVLKAKMNICVPCSAYLLMVVDFSSTLEEDEVHVSFSTKFQVDGFCDTLLEEMDVLVARAPSHLPSDIQRVKVVSRPQLRHLKNVIVFSTKGRSSLADKLSGGDYDGDRAWVCWDQEIVQNFWNAAVPDDDTNPEKLGYLRKLNRSMAQIRREETGDEAVCSKFLHESLAFNMQQSILGKCTDYKERYCYHTKSISSKNIVILSRLLGCLVDQPKQGYIFTNSDWHQFRQDLQIRTLEHDPEYKRERASYNISKQANPHILDYLKHVVAERTVAEALTELTKTLEGFEACHYDEQLTRMFNFYDNHYKNSHDENKATWRNVKNALKEDIESVARLWTNTITKDKDYVASVGSIYQQWHRIQPLPTESSSDLVKLLLQPYMADRQSTLWELLKASFAFKELYNRKTAFLWQMAGRQLAMLKPMMSHSAVMTSCVLVVPGLYGVLKPDKKLIATRRVQRLAETEGIYNLSAGDLEALEWHDDVDMHEETDD